MHIHAILKYSQNSRMHVVFEYEKKLLTHPCSLCTAVITKIKLFLWNIISRKEYDNFAILKASPLNISLPSLFFLHLPPPSPLSSLSISLSFSRFVVGEWPVFRDKIIAEERVLKWARTIEALTRHQRAIIGHQVVRGSIFRTMPAKPYGRPSGFLHVGPTNAKGRSLNVTRATNYCAIPVT